MNKCKLLSLSRFLLAAVCGFWLLGSAAVNASEPDWTLYGEVLQQHVTPGVIEGVAVNKVNYTAIATDPRFPAVVQMVRNFDVAQLQTREEKLAFYINAYNLLTIQLILDNWPLKSIRDIGSFFSGPWDVVMLTNSEGELTLDDIEHKIIRSLGEPRIHFAVNCASVSCPDLRNEPYTAAALDQLLEQQTLGFLSQPGKGFRVDRGNARVSKIFKWYGEDFDDLGGVEAYVRQKVSAEFDDLKTNLPYNWQLNGS